MSGPVGIDHLLDEHHHQGARQSREQHRQRRRFDDPGRLDDHQHADETDAGRQPALGQHRLAEQQHRQQQQEQRPGKQHGGGIGQLHVNDREVGADHRHRTEHAVADLQTQMAGAEAAPARTGENRDRHQNADHRAEKHHLNAVDAPAERLDGREHQRRRAGRADHEKSAAGGGRQPRPGGLPIAHARIMSDRRIVRGRNGRARCRGWRRRSSSGRGRGDALPAVMVCDPHGRSGPDRGRAALRGARCRTSSRK